ncbi:MAG: exodeoxyribonuclease VII small subunit [Longimicrobiales bacterium]
MSERDSSLERTLARLDTIVAALERDDLELEEALRLFEEGVAQVRAAQQTLSAAQLRVERLIEEKGELQLQPMPPTVE